MKTFVAGTLLMLGTLLSGVAAAEAGIDLAVETLNEREFDVPGDLPATPRVLVIGFTHASRTATKAWTEHLKPRCGTQLACYNVSIIEKMPSFARGFALSRMRDEVPVTEHGNWLLVTENSASWMQLAGTRQPDDQAYLVVFTADGSVRARLHGPVSPALDGELGKALTAAP